MAMTTESILDNILVARPNGSDNLTTVGTYLKQFLTENGAEVSSLPFSGTPYGFQLVWSVVLLLMLSYVIAIYRKSYGLALLACLITPVLLLAEFEFLLSPISGILSRQQENIIGAYPGTSDADTLIFVAHYDTATHFGDHFSWGFWGSMQGPAQVLAFLLVVIGFWCRRNNQSFNNAIALPAALLAALPFAAMFWFQSVGPLLRAPSPGAIDNGGSMAALLLLAEKMTTRSPSAPTTVKIVFVSGEEERALGSWAYAQSLLKNVSVTGNVRVVNLESVGASESLAYIPEDGFATRRYKSSPKMIQFINETAESTLGAALESKYLPFGVLTDGRSFLAHNIEAITLRSYTGDSFPRQLHSEHDSRDRLINIGIEKAADLLWALVQQQDDHASQ